MTLQTKTFRFIASLSLLAMAAGCQTSGSGGIFSGGGKDASAAAPAQAATIVRGNCPEVELRQGTANYQTYARGGKKSKDPSKVATQVSLDDTTRQCSVNGGQVTVEVAAAGRAVSGPAGGPGPVEMPIRVAAVDTDGKVIYSQLTRYRTEIPKGSGASQFLFKKAVPLPLDRSANARIFVGFDEGPAGKR